MNDRGFPKLGREELLEYLKYKLKQAEDMGHEEDRKFYIGRFIEEGFVL